MLSAVYKKQYSSMLLLVTVFDEICGSCEDTVNIETIRLKPSTADDTQNNFLSCGGPKSKKINFLLFFRNLAYALQVTRCVISYGSTCGSHVGLHRLLHKPNLLPVSCLFILKPQLRKIERCHLPTIHQSLKRSQVKPSLVSVICN